MRNSSPRKNHPRYRSDDAGGASRVVDSHIVIGTDDGGPGHVPHRPTYAPGSDGEVFSSEPFGDDEGRDSNPRHSTTDQDVPGTITKFSIIIIYQ